MDECTILLKQLEKVTIDRILNPDISTSVKVLSERSYHHYVQLEDARLRSNYMVQLIGNRVLSPKKVF